MYAYEKEEKCKYCEYYQHKDRNVRKPFGCSFQKHFCWDDDKLPQYKEVEDKEARDREFAEYNKIREKISKEDFISEKIAIVLLMSYFLVAIYIGVVGTVYWFTHDNLTQMQIAKYILYKHPIAILYLVGWFIYTLYLKLK